MNDLFAALTGLRLLDPWLLLFALALPVAVFVQARRQAPAILFAPGPFVQGEAGALPPSWRVRLRTVPLWLQLLGLALAVVALARPVQRTPLPLTTTGIDIFLCLDTSSSMAANDLDPQLTRLQVAKAAGAEFVRGRPNDRIGLLTFARYPELRCPLTLDHEALTSSLTAVRLVASDSPEDATGIGTAVARTAQLLRASKARAKVVILLTDGEENVATAQTPEEIAPVHAAQLCQELGVRVYTIAAGTGTQSATGQWVALDPTQLQRVAHLSGGEFFAARDAGAVAAVYARINELEKVEFGEQRFRIEERFLPFLLAGLTLLLASRLLQSTAFEVLP